MNELIGLRNIYSLDDINDIKRELLIFDKIFVVGYYEYQEVVEKQLFKNSSLLEQKGLISLNDFVIYQGFLVMDQDVKKKYGSWEKYYEKTKTDELDFRNQNLDYLVEKGKIIFDYKILNDNNKFDNIHKQITPIIQSKLHNSKFQTSSDFFKLCSMCNDLKTRIISTSYNESKFTAIPCDSSIYEIKDITNIKAKTYNLILQDFPIINVDNLDWEQIFDFKEDPDTYNSIWGLRKWISNISKSETKISEIEEEYRHLKYQYEQAIKIHKLKSSTSIFQTTIQSGAELLENIARLKFGKLSDMLFKFKENEILLMESELKSDGNQLSYLFKVKEKFR